MRLFLVLLLLMSTFTLQASTGEAATKLRSIMNELNMNNIKVVDGVMRGDFAIIESGSLAIAEHERAPMVERKKIVGYLKKRASVFKSIDNKLHNDALSVAEAARNHDMKAVIKNMALVQKGCVACHTTFRAEILQLFSK